MYGLGLVRQVIPWADEGHEVPVHPATNNYLFRSHDEIAAKFDFPPQDLKFELEAMGYQRVRVNGFYYGQQIFTFELEQFPGCCAIGVTSFMFLHDKKYGPSVIWLREKIANALKWGSLLATLTGQQRDQRLLLTKCGWEVISSLKNPKTNNLVVVFEKKVG